MTRTTPAVTDGMLTVHRGRQIEAIPVESRQWWLWLHDPSHRSFRFVHPFGRFTARREVIKTGCYWYAYGKRQGILRKTYLGKAQDLTLARLETAALVLQQMEREPVLVSKEDPAQSLSPLAHPASSSSPEREEAAKSSELPLLLTKMHTPRLPAHLVSRPHLIQRLAAGRGKQLTLVSAPAGSGKTTLIGQWLAVEQISVSWVSLDEGDNDPIRFWSYVSASLDALEPALGASLVEALRSQQLPALESVVTMLVNALTTVSQGGVFVLDDYHVISTPAIHEGVAFLLEHLPAQVHLVVVTRCEPPLPLARLRARGQLTELRTADLRFRTEETALFLTSIMGLDLEPTALTALEVQTEGWIAGLQLAVLSLQGTTDASHSIKEWTGSHRYLLDYLADEVLHRQPPHVQAFLLQTAVLDRLSADLCNALTDREDGEAMLAHLEQANLFLIPLDTARQWYRYHHLFAQFLRDRLRQTSPDLLALLYQRASTWCEHNACMEEAVGYALSAAQHSSQAALPAAELLERVIQTVWMNGELKRLMTWMETLPAQVLAARPRLCLARAWVLHYSGQMAEVEQWLQQAERTIPCADLEARERQGLVGEICAIRALTAYTQNETERTRLLSEQALALLPSDSPWRGMVFYAQGVAAFFMGDDETALHILTEGIAVSQAQNGIQSALFCSWLLAVVQSNRGHLHQSVQTCLEAITNATTSSAGQHFAIGLVYSMLSWLHYEWNELHTAEHYAQETIACGKRDGLVQIERDGLLYLACIRQAQGSIEQARVLLDQVEQIIRRTDRTRAGLALAWQRVQCWLTEGQVQKAAQWVHDYTPQLHDERDPLYIDERLTLARVALAQNQPTEALHLLERERLLELVRRTGALTRELGVLSLQALALFAENRLSEALSVLAQVLSRGEAEGFVRTFLDFGQPMAELLLHLLAAQRQSSRVVDIACSQNYLLKLLQAFGVSVSSSSPPVLSLREVEVLRLMAEGFTEKQIAVHLVISESTVKTYAKRIYARLDVHSRTQAVVRARTLHVL